MEGRDPTRESSAKQTRTRTQCRTDLQRALDRVRQAAKRDKERKLTTLWHHVYDVERLREAYFSLKRKAAHGLDGETWKQYGKNLESNLADLSGRPKL